MPTNEEPKSRSYHHFCPSTSGFAPSNRSYQKTLSSGEINKQVKITLSKSRVPPTVWRLFRPDSPLRWTNFLGRCPLLETICLISRSRALVLLSVFSSLVSESERLTPLLVSAGPFDSRFKPSEVLIGRSISSASCNR